MAKHISVGIDIGTTATRVVVGEFVRGEKFPKIIGVGFSESHGLRHGYITNIEKAAGSIRRAVNSAEKNSGVKIRKAIFSIGGVSLGSEITYGSTIISKADSEVTVLDVSKAITESENNLEIINKRVIHTLPVSFKLDGKEVTGRPEGMKGIKLEVKTLFVTCLEQHLEDMIAAATEAGIEVLDIIAGPLASSLVILNSKQKNAGCLVADIGGETVSIAVFENNTPISLHVFSIGSTEITHDNALGLKIALEEAENLKIGSLINSYPKKKLEQIITARLSDIFELIEGHLKKIKRSGLLPAGVLLIGGGSNMSLVENISKNILNLPAKVITPEMFPYSKGKIKNAGWFTVLGLSIAGRDVYGQDFSYNSFRRFIRNIKNFFKSIGNQLLP